MVISKNVLRLMENIQIQIFQVKQVKYFTDRKLLQRHHTLLYREIQFIRIFRRKFADM